MSQYIPVIFGFKHMFEVKPWQLKKYEAAMQLYHRCFMTKHNSKLYAGNALGLLMYYDYLGRKERGLA
jgi:hypothetical protein